MLLKLLFASLAYCQFAPLESQNGVMLGAWLDTQPGGETPSAFNTRMGFNSSFFQMAQDFPLDFNKPPPVQLITQTGTNAMLYLTVYPRTFASIVDNDINELVKQIGGFTNSGFQVFLRFAPGWFVYAQQPTAFIALWRRVVTAVRASPLTKGKVAFVWGPNLGFGYPYPGGAYSINSTTSPDFLAMDTNGDGKLDAADDPYSPFYPGDDFVDWVALSIYYFGQNYPWVANALPATTAFTDLITGANGNGGVDFYAVYAARRGKPMLIAETGASFHRYLIAGNATIAPGPGELALKQAFWRQYITNPTVLGNYPKIKAICLFEWAKDEELTFRDFRISTDPAILAAFKEDFNVQNVKAKYLLAGAAGSPIAGTSKSAATTTTLSLLAFSLLVVLVL